MKKSLRKILAAVLITVMAFSSFTAFAAEDKESITLWSDIVLPYAGELKEGESQFDLSEGNGNAYISFTAEKDGYYAFTGETEGYYYTNWLRPLAEEEEGKYDYGVSRIFHSVDEWEITTVYYFEAGDIIFGIFLEGADASTVDITSEYMGTEMTNIDFSAGIEYPMISEYDLEPTVYEAPGYSYYFYVRDLVVTFDSDKVIGNENGLNNILYCSSETEMTDGEYTVNVYFADKTFEKTIEVRPVTAYIEKIEAIDPEKFYGVEYYDGDRFYLGCNATYNVTFTSGETVQVGSETDFEVPGLNRELWISRNYNETSEGAVVEIEVLDYEFAEYPCEIKPAEASENFSHMAEECSSIISRFAWECEWLYNRMEEAESKADTLRAWGVWISHINNNLIYILGDLIAEFNACLAYTIVNS